MNLLTPEALLQAARERTGLDDFGPDRFLEPLGVLCRSLNEEAQLNAMGVAVQGERITNALANRLRRIDLLRRHPEILDEQVAVGAIIIGLPRTGSTMLQRLLAAAPNATAPFWWETIYPLPRDNSGQVDIDARKTDAAALSAALVAASPGLEAIHPMNPFAHDEDLPIIEQSLVSNMPEAFAHVPSYGAWLAAADQHWSYAEEVQWLQILQWQNPERRAQKWILKAPHHLTAVGTVLETFPGAVVVMTHRRVEHVMGSYFSMVASLNAGGTDADLSHLQAAHWANKLCANLADMMRTRDAAPDRFVDVFYDRLIPAPRDHARAIFAAAGMSVDEGVEAAWTGWLDTNRRDNRPGHKYDLGDYGFSPGQLRKQFAFYIDAFGLDG